MVNTEFNFFFFKRTFKTWKIHNFIANAGFSRVIEKPKKPVKYNSSNECDCRHILTVISHLTVSKSEEFEYLLLQVKKNMVNIKFIMW